MLIRETLNMHIKWRGFFYCHMYCSEINIRMIFPKLNRLPGNIQLSCINSTVLLNNYRLSTIKKVFII